MFRAEEVEVICFSETLAPNYSNLHVWQHVMEINIDIQTRNKCVRKANSDTTCMTLIVHSRDTPNTNTKTLRGVTKTIPKFHKYI